MRLRKHRLANGALWIEDTTTVTSSGEPGDCVGLKISTYSATEIVFTFGPAYRSWPALASGDGYQLTVAGIRGDWHRHL